jgi:hypothetical protein
VGFIETGKWSFPVVLEKGKPLEREGRKATGLSPLRIGSQGCRADEYGNSLFFSVYCHCVFLLGLFLSVSALRYFTNQTKSNAGVVVPMLL